MKKSFITGLIILLPIAVTFFLLSFILDIFTAPFVDSVTKLLYFLKGKIPNDLIVFLSKILIIILFCIGVFILGILGRVILFRSFFTLTNLLLLKIPFLKSIYHTSKDFITSIFSIDEKKAFKYPVMLDFPSSKSSIVGFLSGSVPQECTEILKQELEPIFVPTAPHPISGYFLLVPKEKVSKINMTNEKAIKFIVSCGVITPETTEDIDAKKT